MLCNCIGCGVDSFDKLLILFITQKLTFFNILMYLIIVTCLQLSMHLNVRSKIFNEAFPRTSDVI